ncbi:MAG: hypothetical protein MOB07_07035 [Acidobacteria bacterium]|nr:hypothetical protein [Acidobacteriota bacterium]
MDTFTMKAALAIGVLLLIGFLWLVWKFFAKLFKHVIIVLLISVAGSAFYYYRSLPPPPPPYIGKHAYMKENGEYIGVVEAEGNDNRRGPVWIIRPVGGYPQRYSKSRVTLKDKMELKPEQTPAPESKPASDKIDSNANKVDKKKKS